MRVWRCGSGFIVLFSCVYKCMIFLASITQKTRYVTKIKSGLQTKHFLLSGSCPVTGLFPCQTGLFINVKFSRRLIIYMTTFDIFFNFSILDITDKIINEKGAITHASDQSVSALDVILKKIMELGKLLLHHFQSTFK